MTARPASGGHSWPSQRTFPSCQPPVEDHVEVEVHPSDLLDRRGTTSALPEVGHDDPVVAPRPALGHRPGAPAAEVVAVVEDALALALGALHPDHMLAGFPPASRIEFNTARHRSTTFP